METENELLLYIYQDSKMATTNLTTLLTTINNKDNKIKKTIEEILTEYEKYLKESEKLLKKQDIEPKEKSIIANFSSKMGIKSEIAKDNSDSRIADMLIKGLSMGSIDMQKKIDNFKDITDKKIIDLAKKLKSFQEKQIEELKKYL